VLDDFRGPVPDLVRHMDWRVRHQQQHPGTTGCGECEPPPPSAYDRTSVVGRTIVHVTGMSDCVCVHGHRHAQRRSHRCHCLMLVRSPSKRVHLSSS
jgi:hypothetical protein